MDGHGVQYGANEQCDKNGSMNGWVLDGFSMEGYSST